MKVRAEFRHGAWSLTVTAESPAESAILAQMEDLGRLAHTSIGSSYDTDTSSVTAITVSWIESKP